MSSQTGSIARPRRFAAIAVSVMLLLASTAGASSLDYITRLTGGASESDALALVVAVHGLGDRPETFAHVFDDVTTPARIILPRGPVAHGSGYSWFESPATDVGGSALASGLAAAAGDVAELAAAVAKSLPTKGKPIVTGFSQGGMVSFAVAALHPQAIAMAIPLSGFLPGSIETAGNTGEASGSLPGLVALHGTDDPRIPIGLAKVSVARLEIAGYDARLEPFAGVAHSVSRAMRRRLADLIATAAGRDAGPHGGPGSTAKAPDGAPPPRPAD